MTSIQDWIECKGNLPRDICNEYRKWKGYEPVYDNGQSAATDQSSQNKSQEVKKTPQPCTRTIDCSDFSCPGSQLKYLLYTIGITPKVDCPCHLIAGKMDSRGAAWCRTHRHTLVNEFRGNASRYSWGETLSATWASLITGIAWKLSLTDPFGSLFDEAVRRAEEKVPYPLDCPVFRDDEPKQPANTGPADTPAQH